tara:strand:+ start:19442 stop:20557 length:1116 start_codon:yes stop_codon:yes gene_type:complete
MLKVTIGDMFESNATTLVNTVNCVGVMGKGVAQIFKQRYPDMFLDYVRRCELKQVEPGVPYHYCDMLGNSIVNFPTKNHWRSSSRLDDIIKGLDVFISEYKRWGITSVAFPPLGCGNGGLAWSLVGPLMYQKLSQLDIPVEIYAPFGTPRQQLLPPFLNQSVNSEVTKEKTARKLSAELIALIEVVKRLEAQSHASPVGRTVFQKISYIMTELGIDTGFHFKQGSYGPFSPEVKEALSTFANANLIQEKQLGRMTVLRVGSEFENIRHKFEEELKIFDKKIDKTVDLFSRIKSTEQAEEVATVLYSSRQLKKSVQEKSTVSEKDIYDYVLNWKKTWKKEEKHKAVASTIRNLEMLGWLQLQYSESLPAHEA